MEKKPSSTKTPPLFNPTSENVKKVADAFKKTHSEEKQKTKRRWAMTVI
ncbi:hypothetical protein ACJJIR_01235 [Microbulbifer sp. SSSA008]